MKTKATRAQTAKLDLYQTCKAEYVTPRKPVLLQLRKATYLAIAGNGAPGTNAFQQAISALYNMAFTIKMASKFAGRDYAVCKLEALCWVESGRLFLTEPKEKWLWKLLIRTPDFIGKRDLEAARRQLIEKGKGPLIEQVELVALNENWCVQMLHVGPYDKELETIRKLSTFTAEQGRRFDGLHHEIYLSDPRRIAPDRLHTILRIPVSQ
jgi:hypothetical protein